jgi:hypothetical protein
VDRKVGVRRPAGETAKHAKHAKENRRAVAFRVFRVFRGSIPPEFGALKRPVPLFLVPLFLFPPRTECKRAVKESWWIVKLEFFARQGNRETRQTRERKPARSGFSRISRISRFHPS